MLAGESGIRMTLIAFCTALLVLIWVVVYHQAAFERDHALATRESENDDLAQLFEENVLRTLAAASVALKQIGSEYRRHGAELDLKSYLRERREELEPYSVLSVIDEKGDLRLSSLPISTPQNYRDSENFLAHSRDGSPAVHVSRPRLGRVSGQVTVYLTARINKPDGGFGGLAVVGMDPTYFSRLYAKVRLGADSVIALTGSDGVVRARQSNSPAMQGNFGPGVRNADLFPGDPIVAAHGRFRATSPVDNVRRLFSYRDIPGSVLMVLVGTSEAAALAEVAGRTRLYAWAAAAASLMILAFCALMLSQMKRSARVTEELRVSKERYALVERATNDGIWDMNLQTGASYLSSRGREILGYQPDEPIVGLDSFFERVHPDDVSRVREALTRSVQGCAPYRMEYRLQHPEGGRRWLLSRGEVVCDGQRRPVRMVRAFTDLTVRKETEQQLAEQARLLQLIFRHSLDGIVLLDKDFNFIRVSEAYARSCQRDAASFPGQNHFALYPSDLEQEIAPFRREKKVYSRSARPFVFPDHPEWGTTYWDLGLVPILDTRGEIEMFLLTLKDVTARVRAEEQLLDRTARLRALSGRVVQVQEEERRALSRELHDEIGQGLTAVKVRLQSLGRAGAGGAYTISTGNLEATLGVVTHLLERVRGLSLDLRPMQLDDLGLGVALSSLAARSAASAGWRLHMNEDLPAARLAPDLELACYRVAQEALTNVMRHACASEVWVDLRQVEQTLLLMVRDNGCGFDLATARSPSGPPHLGMLGMEERVINMAGRLEIQTRPGEGTEVRARFPVVPSATPSAVRA